MILPTKNMGIFIVTLVYLGKMVSCYDSYSHTISYGIPEYSEI